GPVYLHRLLDETPAAGMGAAYAEMVRDAYLRRRLLTVARDALSLAQSGTGDVEDLLATVRARMAEATEPAAAGGRSARLDKYAVDGWQFITDASESRDPLWGKPDTAVWPQGESLMICGKPGIGKTT
ncbi:helicase DnaB, partial [Streptomyces sp. TRM76130]|nr:helicase DnaB [Streptomyces sp. TRM76130]